MISLVIDTSHSENFIGLFNESNDWLIAKAFTSSPYEALPYHFNEVIKDSNTNLKTIESIYMPCAPGSTLGIRIAQMFVQGLITAHPYQPQVHVHTYNGFFLSALYLKNFIKDNQEAHLIAENGRDKWNSINLNDLEKPKVSILNGDKLPLISGDIYVIPQSKSWKTPPKTARKCIYSAERFLPFLKNFKQSKVNHERLMNPTMSYQKWNEQQKK